MIGFEVSVNGEVVCTAGIPVGLLHLRLNSAGPSNEVGIDVGAVAIIDKNADLAPKLRAALQNPEAEAVYARWLNQQLKAGDEITVRIVDRSECDPPKWIVKPPDLYPPSGAAPPAP